MYAKHIGKLTVFVSLPLAVLTLWGCPQNPPAGGPYSLVTALRGEGSVDLVPTGGEYDSGTQVEVAAAPENGWVFDHWEGLLQGTANPDTLTVSADEVLTAVFVEEGSTDPAGQEQTIKLPGDVQLKLVWIPGGIYMMGSLTGEQGNSSNEQPRHRVILTEGFWMGKYELTKAQWQAVMGTTPWASQGNVLDDPNSPAVFVSWNLAKEFLAALSDYTGEVFRLPYEAEWEYACRAGTTTRFYWGDDVGYAEIGNYAWYGSNAADIGKKYAHVVGQKLPNAWGLFDMSGNAFEQCEDKYGGYSSGTNTDPTGPEIGGYQVLRGGDCYVDAKWCRSAARDRLLPIAANYYTGFRVVMEPTVR